MPFNSWSEAVRLSGFSVSFQRCTAITTINFEKFPSPQKALHTVGGDPMPLTPAPGKHSSSFCLPRLAPSRQFPEMEPEVHGGFQDWLPSRCLLSKVLSRFTRVGAGISTPLYCVELSLHGWNTHVVCSRIRGYMSGSALPFSCYELTCCSAHPCPRLRSDVCLRFLETPRSKPAESAVVLRAAC